MILRASEGLVQLEVTLPENPKIREVVRESLQAIIDALNEDEPHKPKPKLKLVPPRTRTVTHKPNAKG